MNLGIRGADRGGDRIRGQAGAAEDGGDRHADDLSILSRGLKLWTFVHGLSFLLIDDKVSAMEIPLDLHEMVADATRRFLRDD